MLFPLTEYVPEVMDTPWVRGLLPWLGTWKRGPGPQALDFPLRGGRVLKVAPLICYEAIFPGYVAEAVRKGAELIVTISNDSWFGTSAGPKAAPDAGGVPEHRDAAATGAGDELGHLGLHHPDRRDRPRGADGPASGGVDDGASDRARGHT